MKLTYTESELRELFTSGTPEQYKEFTDTFNALANLVRTLRGERQERLYAEQKARTIADLKKAKPMTKVYYMRNNSHQIPYGTELLKIANGTKRMQCITVKGQAKWHIDYAALTLIEPTADSIATNRGLVKLLTS